MSICAQIIGDSQTRVWGLTSLQRKRRVLKAAGVTDIVDNIAAVPAGSSVVFFRGDFLFDDRVINYMVQAPNVVLKIPREGKETVVAAHVPSGQAAQIEKAIANDVAPPSLDGLKIETLETLAISFQEQLLKFEPPFVLPITSDNAPTLERILFDWSYKGVTDLVTKWIWPRPAQWVVGRCVHFGLRPNHVTIIGLILVVLAAISFASGRYGWGLLAGWLMTFLDTVDGKLARVTVTSSKFGHYFDHIIDLIHPPIWYIIWGMGLGITEFSYSGISLSSAYWLIVIGYVAGRLGEGIFLAKLGKFGLFCWRPIDSYFRLITARRNPCMILLTISVLAGRPDWGLFLVTVWTVLTSIFLVIRLGLAIYRRRIDGYTVSWFSDIDPTRPEQPLAVRLFAHRTDGL